MRLQCDAGPRERINLVGKTLAEFQLQQLADRLRNALFFLGGELDQAIMGARWQPDGHTRARLEHARGANRSARRSFHRPPMIII